MKEKVISLILAICFSFWAFLYTWQEDKWKFFIWGAISIIGLPLLFPTILIWISVIITTVSRDEKWYKSYGGKKK